MCRVLALEETKVSLATRETKASKVLLVLGVPRECRALWATGALQVCIELRSHVLSSGCAGNLGPAGPAGPIGLIGNSGPAGALLLSAAVLTQ